MLTNFHLTVKETTEHVIHTLSLQRFGTKKYRHLTMYCFFSSKGVSILWIVADSLTNYSKFFFVLQPTRLLGFWLPCQQTQDSAMAMRLHFWLALDLWAEGG